MAFRWIQALGRTAGAHLPLVGGEGLLGRWGTFGYGKGYPDPQGNYGKSRSYGVTYIEKEILNNSGRYRTGWNCKYFGPDTK